MAFDRGPCGRAACSNTGLTASSVDSYMHEVLVLLQAGACNRHGSDQDATDQALHTVAV